MDSRPLIAIDFDDVISSQTDLMIEFSNERYGTHWTRDTFKEPGEYWGYEVKLWGVGEAEGNRRFQEFLDERHPLRQTIQPEVLVALKELGTGFRLSIVTSRGLDYKDDTNKQVEALAPSLFEAIHYVADWDKPEDKATKATVCMDIGANYLIDDSVGHCNAVAEQGVGALLFGDFGWGRGVDLLPNVTRVADWAAVLEYFDGQR